MAAGLLSGIPGISIIVPVYNTQKFLPQCIGSLLSQTLGDIEIILVDDGSTDASGRICDEHARQDDRVIVIHKENEGVSIARNTGIERSSGKWICFIDSDDWAEPDMCERALQYAEENDLDLLCFNTFVNHSNNQIKSMDVTQCILAGEEIAAFQLCLINPQFYNASQKAPLGDVGGCPKKLFRGDLLRESDVRFISALTRGEDIVYNLQISEFFGRIGFINEFWYHYRTHKESTTHAFKTDLPKATLLLLEYVREYIDAGHRGSAVFEAAYGYSVLRSLNGLCIQHYFHKENRARLSARLRELMQAAMTEPYSSALQTADTGHFRLDDRLFSFFLKKRMAFFVWLLVKARNMLYTVLRGKM